MRALLSVVRAIPFIDDTADWSSFSMGVSTISVVILAHTYVLSGKDWRVIMARKLSPFSYDTLPTLSL